MTPQLVVGALSVGLAAVGLAQGVLVWILSDMKADVRELRAEVRELRAALAGRVEPV